MVTRSLSRFSPRIIAARSLSAVMQPTVTVIPLLALFNGLLEPNVSFARWLVWSCVTITCATTIPSIIFLVLLRNGMIADLSISNRNERYLAYLVMIPLYFIGAGLARGLAVPRRTSLLLGAVTICLMIGAAVNHWFCKCSIHTMSAALMSVALITAYGAVFWPMVALTVAVGWARVTIRAHTLGEVLTGGAVGGIVGTCVFFLL